MNEILKKLSNENEAQYIWRIGNAKSQNLIDDTWESISPIMNKELGYAEEDWKGESAWRKRYRNYSEAYEQIFSKEQFNNTADVTKELYKAKKQYEDQRRECRKIWTEEARFNNLTEKLIQSVNNLCESKPLNFDDCVFDTGNSEAVLCCTDWHYGLVTDNIWNKYNTDICRYRVKKLVSKTIEYLYVHKVKKLYVMLLGDAAHGGLHCTCRVASEEDVCDQLIHVSEIIAEAMNELSKYVPELNVYTTYGNHLRTIQNKQDSIHSDNMEKIIGWWLEQRLQNNDRVNIIKSDYYEFIYLNVCGHNIVGAHGDLDKFKQFGLTVNTLFSKKYGQTIDYAISADKHHIEEFEQMGIESILVPSLCGVDEYANNNRLYSMPGQTLMIFTPEDGRQCTYNIKF